MTATVSDLVEKLRGEWELLSGFSIDRGSVDAGISANLAAEAADRIEALERERDEARVRFDKHSDYTIQLQRIIEAICHGRELRPDSAELHHHKMAAQFIAASQAEASRLREALDASRATLSDIRTFLVREFGTVDTEVNGVVGWIDEAIGPVQPVAALSSGSKT